MAASFVARPYPPSDRQTGRYRVMFDNWKQPRGLRSLAHSPSLLRRHSVSMRSGRDISSLKHPSIATRRRTPVRNALCAAPHAPRRYNCNLQKLYARGAGGRPQSSGGGIADVIWRKRNEKSSVFGHLLALAHAIELWNQATPCSIYRDSADKHLALARRERLML